MLLKKNVLNEINKEGTFTQGFKDKGKRKVSQDLDDLQNLLIKLTVKASPEKAWLLYEVTFSLNPVINQMMYRHERTIHHYIQ